MCLLTFPNLSSLICKMTTICYFVKIRDVVSKSWTHSGFSVNDSYFLTYICIYLSAAASLQSCPTLCDPIDGSPPGSPVPGILQTRTLEWVAISFSNAWKWKVTVKSLSRLQLLATAWTAAYQAPPSIGFSRQEYWRGVPLPSPIYLSTFNLFLFLSIYLCRYVDLSC